MGLGAGGCVWRARGEGEGKEARLQLPRTMAALPPPTPFLPLSLPSLPPPLKLGLAAFPAADLDAGPATRPASTYLQRHLLGPPVRPQAAQELQGALAVTGPLPLADGDVQLGHLRGAGRDVNVVGHGGGRSDGRGTRRQGLTALTNAFSAVQPATERKFSTSALDKAAPPPRSCGAEQLGRAGGAWRRPTGCFPWALHLPAHRHRRLCHLPPARRRRPRPRGSRRGG